MNLFQFDFIIYYYSLIQLCISDNLNKKHNRSHLEKNHSKPKLKKTHTDPRITQSPFKAPPPPEVNQKLHDTINCVNLLAIFNLPLTRP